MNVDRVQQLRASRRCDKFVQRCCLSCALRIAESYLVHFDYMLPYYLDKSHDTRRIGNNHAIVEVEVLFLCREFARRKDRMIGFCGALVSCQFCLLYTSPSPRD